MENEPVLKKEVEIKDEEGEIKKTRTPEEAFNYYQRDFNIPTEDLRTKLVLDVGANDGQFIRYLRENLGNNKAVALEFQEIRIAKDRPEWWIVASGLDIPFADDSFEIITAHNYLPMFYDRGTKAIEELVRILSKGGKLYFDGRNSEKIAEEITEAEDMVYDSEEDKLKTMRYIENRIEGAKLYEEYYKKLQNIGFEVNQNGNVWIIKKPQ